MAMWEYVKRVEQPNGASSNLTMKDIEAVQKSISKALDVATSTKSRGKYRINVNESRLKSEYLNKLEEISKQRSQNNDSTGEPVVITTLETKDRGNSE